MHKKDPRFLFEKRRGQPCKFWSLVSIIDGSTLPQDCVEVRNSYAEHEVTGKKYNLNEAISLSSSKSYRRAEIGYVMEVNFIRK